MDEHSAEIVSNWKCLICGEVYPAVSCMPRYCSACGFNLFQESETISSSRPGRISPQREPYLPPPFRRRPSPDSQVLGSPPIAPVAVPRGERRRAKRVRPQRPLQILISTNKPLEILDISTSGLAVEHETAFSFGFNYEAEIGHSKQKIRLRLQMVRSLIGPTLGKGSSAIRYRTGFQFLDALPPAFFTLIPELCEAL